MNKFYVYLIKNIQNGKLYVGKSNNIKERLRCHIKAAKTKRKKDYTYLHRAINKHGSDSFEISVLAEFDNEEEAYKNETVWIRKLKSNNRDIGYNLNEGGLGGIQPTPEVRAKLIAFQNKPEVKKAKSERMKKRHQENPGFLGKINKGNQYTKGRKLTQEHIDRISKFNKGKVKSKETREKLSKSLIGHEVSKETKEKISRANLKCSNLTEKEVLEIRAKYIPKKYTYKMLATEYKVSPVTISRIVKRIRWSHI